MKPRHQVSRAAIELIKRFEGYRSKAAQLPDGRWTIGYGHTLTAREGASVSQEDAEALLIYDLIAVAHAINERTFTPLTQNQFDALCAFTFNIGVESFRRSAVLRRLNEGAHLQAACAMELWRKADFEGERIVIDALVRRRAAEKSLFLTPPGGYVPAPTPVLRPNLDLDGTGSVPRETPTALTASLEGGVTSLERDAAPQPAFADLQPSPAQAAAAAVSARLATIFPDEPEEAATGLAEPELEPEAEAPTPAVTDTVAAEAEPDLPPIAEPVAEPEPVFELVAAEPESEPEPKAEEETPAIDPSEPTLFDALVEPANDIEAPEPEPEARPASDDEFPRILSLEPEPADFEAEPETAPRFNYLPLVALAAFGGAIFGGGIFWSVSAQGGPGGAWAFGWLAALVGILVLGRAAYLFLERLGQIGGGLDDDDPSRA